MCPFSLQVLLISCKSLMYFLFFCIMEASTGFLFTINLNTLFHNSLGSFQPWQYFLDKLGAVQHCKPATSLIHGGCNYAASSNYGLGFKNRKSILLGFFSHFQCIFGVYSGNFVQDLFIYLIYTSFQIKKICPRQIYNYAKCKWLKSLDSKIFMLLFMFEYQCSRLDCKYFELKRKY